MPPRNLHDVLVVDRSSLAQKMYPFLFTQEARFKVRFADEFETLFKRSVRFRPNILVINSNVLPRQASLDFPCPTILIVSADRFDLKESMSGRKDVMIVEKPFYPYDLVSVANRLVMQSRPLPPRKKGSKKKGEGK